MLPPRFAVLGIAAATVLGGCGHAGSSLGPAAVAEGCRAGSGITAHVATRSYIIQLDIRPIERIYTQAQSDAQHPSQGEVLLRGHISAVSESGYHLEAHICSRAGGAVIQDADPTITLVNDATKTVSQDVQIAVMHAVGADVGDLHYGNNVVLAPGAVYTVLVSLNGETAMLHVVIPSADATGTTTASPVTDMRGMP